MGRHFTDSLSDLGHFCLLSQLHPLAPQPVLETDHSGSPVFCGLKNSCEVLSNGSRCGNSTHSGAPIRQLPERHWRREWNLASIRRIFRIKTNKNFFWIYPHHLPYRCKKRFSSSSSNPPLTHAAPLKATPPIHFNFSHNRNPIENCAVERLMTFLWPV